MNYNVAQQSGLLFIGLNQLFDFWVGKPLENHKIFKECSIKCGGEGAIAIWAVFAWPSSR